MKTFIAGVIAVSTLVAIASPAAARPHRHQVKVCSMAHHHRVCHMVWR